LHGVAVTQPPDLPDLPLPAIERELLDELERIGLRTTLTRAARIGALLLAAREQIHEVGGWSSWLRRVALNRKTASDYVCCYKGWAAGVRPVGRTVGLRSFLEAMRRGRKAERQAQLEDEADAPQRAGCRIHTADADRFPWRGQADGIFTDPPWDSDEAYTWLASFAVERLAERACLFVMCKNGDLAERLSTLTAAGLVYRQTFALVLSATRSFRPVLVLSRPCGPPILRACNGAGNAFVCLYREQEFQTFEQPVAPFQSWIAENVRPGGVVWDPFTGTGSVAVAALKAGRRFVGTEIHPGTARLARRRLAAVT
jgi:hypothetical protein